MFFKHIFIFSLIFINVLSTIFAEAPHNIEKRQIGVLARTGALPQGKRSVEVLARNGELPRAAIRKEFNGEDTQDLLIDELEKAETLSELRAEALAQKALEENEGRRFGSDKRSVAALARNGELPQKKSSESANARSGYLVRPPLDPVQSSPDLLDPDDFLVTGQKTMMPEFSDEEIYRTFLSAAKRNLGSAKNFLLESGTNSRSKKNLASFARDGGFEVFGRPTIKERREEIEPRRQRSALYIQRNLEELENPSGETFYIGKRFLGRIPQLGRIHKVQAPSARRRPHLRPNWL